MPGPFHLILNNQEFLLYPDKVVFWKNQDALLVADAHFGKVSHFRKSGLQVPPDSVHENAVRLEKMLCSVNPAVCYFLGDLFHSYLNNEWMSFEQIVLDHSKIRFVLIRGNHDVIDEKKFNHIGIQIMDEVVISEIHLTHQPLENPEKFNICGHIHPGVKLSSRVNFTEKLPCFFLRQNQLILPSFGSFTGKKVIHPKQGDRVFVVAGEKVLEVGT